MQMLDVMKTIEDGAEDQHSGSYKVGELLKQLYIDRAVKRGEKLDKQFDENKRKKKSHKNISWSEFKAKTK